MRCYRLFPFIKTVFFLFLCFFLLCACQGDKETVRVRSGNISESVYASGIIKSKGQYQVFALASGIIETVFVKEGDTVKKGQPVLFIANDIQRLSKENAQLAAAFSDFNTNKGKLHESRAFADLAKMKMENDSLLFERQSTLWSQNIGSRVEFEQRQLAFRNSKTAYLSALTK